MMVGLGDSLVDSIAQAIYQMEGNGPTTIATRNNNPGNLRSGAGQIGTNGGYAVFPDMATGWAALDAQIQLNINRGLTLTEFFAGKPGVYAGYAPAADSNQPISYANFVGSQAGIPVDVPLNQIQAGGSFGIATSNDPGAVDSSGDTTSTDTTGDAGLFGMDPNSTMIVVGLAALAVGTVFFMSGGSR